MRYLVPLTQTVLVLLGVAFTSGFGALSLGKNPTSAGVGIGFGLLVLALFLVYAAALLSPVEKRNGIVQTAGCLSLISLLGAAVVVPVYLSAGEARRRSDCMSEIKQLNMAMMMYLDGSGDRFPPARSWSDAIRKAGGEADRKCPIAISPYNYAMNSALDRKPIAGIYEIARTVLLFEADAWAPNPSGGKEWVSRRHGNGSYFGYADGHASFRGVGELPTPDVWVP